MPRLGYSFSLRRNSPNVHPKCSTKLLLGTILVLFVLKNIFFRDYRIEQVAELKAHGMSQEEIDALVPRSAKERRQYVTDTKNDFEKLKRDVAYLMQEVHELRANVRTPHSRYGGAGGGEDELFMDIDRIHEEKRRRKEAQQGAQKGETLAQLRGRVDHLQAHVKTQDEAEEADKRFIFRLRE